MISRLLSILLALIVVTLAPAQTQKTTSVADLIKDVTSLLAKHYPNQADLHKEVYADKLKAVKGEVAFLTDEAKHRIDDLGLQQKLNLALELWRIRASLDLLSLADPATLKELTGLDLPDLRDLRRRFNKAQSILSSALPGL
jgi:hypothetical protein